MPTPITSMSKEYAVLSTGGGGITVAGADMASGSFVGVAWSNTTFTACDFVGDGNIKLASMSGCKFVNCNFLAPNHDFGVMTDVTFTQCKSVGRSIFCGKDGSSGVVFDGCDFSGGGSAPEAFEGIGSTGKVTFRNCTGSGEVLVAGTQLTIDNCKFSNMTFVIGRQRKRGAPLAATVLIDNSHGTGRWRMVECRMKTSHIQNSTFDEIVNDGSECEV